MGETSDYFYNCWISLKVIDEAMTCVESIERTAERTHALTLNNPLLRWREFLWSSLHHLANKTAPDTALLTSRFAVPVVSVGAKKELVSGL